MTTRSDLIAILGTTPLHPEKFEALVAYVDSYKARLEWLWSQPETNPLRSTYSVIDHYNGVARGQNSRLDMTSEEP